MSVLGGESCVKRLENVVSDLETKRDGLSLTGTRRRVRVIGEVRWWKGTASRLDVMTGGW